MHTHSYMHIYCIILYTIITGTLLLNMVMPIKRWAEKLTKLHTSRMTLSFNRILVLVAACFVTYLEVRERTVLWHNTKNVCQIYKMSSHRVHCTANIALNNSELSHLCYELCTQ